MPPQTTTMNKPLVTPKESSSTTKTAAATRKPNGNNGKAPIQTDVRSTEGAHNKNNALSRVIGATAMNSYVELAHNMQVHEDIRMAQKKKFVNTWTQYLPAVDRQTPGLDVDAQCLAICFNRVWEYKRHEKEKEKDAE